MNIVSNTLSATAINILPTVVINISNASSSYATNTPLPTIYNLVPMDSMSTNDIDVIELFDGNRLVGLPI